MVGHLVIQTSEEELTVWFGSAGNKHWCIIQLINKVNLNQWKLKLYLTLKFLPVENSISIVVSQAICYH